jgi:hypothetical protein
VLIRRCHGGQLIGLAGIGARISARSSVDDGRRHRPDGDDSWFGEAVQRDHRDEQHKGDEEQGQPGGAVCSGVIGCRAAVDAEVEQSTAVIDAMLPALPVRAVAVTTAGA